MAKTKGGREREKNGILNPPHGRHFYQSSPVLDEGAVPNGHLLEYWTNKAGFPRHDELETVNGDKPHVLGRRGKSGRR